MTSSDFSSLVRRRYYFMPDLWYKLSAPALRFVRLGDGRHEWHFDRVVAAGFSGFWRSVDEVRFAHHLLFRRVGE